MALGLKSTEAARAFNVSHQTTWAVMHPQKSKHSYDKYRTTRRAHYNKLRREWYQDNKHEILRLRKLSRKEAIEAKAIQAVLREKVMEKAKLMGLI